MSNTSATSTKSTTKFVTEDNVEMTGLNAKLLTYSTTIKNLLEDIQDKDTPIPLTVSSDALTLVDQLLEFVENVSEKKEDEKKELTEEEKKKKEHNDKKVQEILVSLTKDRLFSLILATNYLDIKCLLDLGCKRVADMLKGKSTEQIRQEFNIKNDFTPEEEEKIRKENEWLLDEESVKA